MRPRDKAADERSEKWHQKRSNEKYGCSGKGKATKENFAKVKEGMTVKEVEGIMGTGKEASEAVTVQASLDTGFVLPGKDDSKVAVKVWEAGDDKFVVIFKEEKVVKFTTVKGDVKPKDKDDKDKLVKLTKENLGKIKKGMTKKQVEDLIGPGKSKKEKDTEEVTWEEGRQQLKITFDKEGTVKEFDEKLIDLKK